jgi:hypothetical protein
VLVLSSLSGEINKIVVVQHRESQSFFQKVIRLRIYGQLRGKDYQDKFELGEDIDNITGATYTTQGIVKATKRAIRKIAKKGMNLQIPPEESPSLHFGNIELSLIFIFLFALIGTWEIIKPKHLFRWISMLSGLIFIGFVFKRPLSITFINKLMIGTFPSFIEHFYWYLLLILVFFPILFLKKNLYCERICPFGAFQEGISAISGTKRVRFKGFKYLKWVQRIMVLTAISAALILRKPSISNYEVFDVAFNLLGATFKFILLGVVLLFSFFLIRPWCNMLCPIRVITDSVGVLRHWVKDVIRKD